MNPYAYLQRLAVEFAKARCTPVAEITPAGVSLNMALEQTAKQLFDDTLSSLLIDTTNVTGTERRGVQSIVVHFADPLSATQFINEVNRSRDFTHNLKGK